MAKVVFHPEEKVAETPRGEDLLGLSRKADMSINSLCNGQGACGKCKIVVTKGKGYLNELTDSERRLLNEREIKEGYRLACQAEVEEEGSLAIEVPPETSAGEQVLQLEGVEAPVKLEPSIRRVVVEIPKPSLEEPMADAERLLESMAGKLGLKDLELSPRALEELPHAFKEGKGTVSPIVWEDQKILDVQPRSGGPCLGFAVDIGTTKLAGYLVDNITGELMGVSSAMNPQIRYGEDVISRVAHASRVDGGLQELRKAVIGAINGLIDEACGKADVSKRDIYEVVAVGNTAMHHLFLGFPPDSLGSSPYTPVVRSSLDLRAKDLSIDINEGARVHVLPVIADFVGADTVGMILSTEIYRSDLLTLAIDIGTNTEIVLGNEDGLTACSAASGPAFEGGRIKHGMRAASGAIEEVEIDPETLKTEYRTIGGARPKGICGSAALDALAGMLKAHVVNKGGKIDADLDSDRIRLGAEDVPEFVIAWQEETSINDAIVITQGDVRELQLAKAAISTGIKVLMERNGVDEGELERVLVAGDFGTHLNPSSAKDIGMFPRIPLDRVKSIGNAAGSGARMALLSKRVRKLAEEAANRVKYIELAAKPNFQEEFLNAIYFPSNSPA